MYDKIRRLGEQTVLYSMGSALNKLLGFFLIPVYSKYIPIADYGILAIFEITILFLTSILHFGIVSGHQRYFYIEKTNNTYGSFLFSSFLSNIALTTLSISIFIIFSKSFSNLLFSTPAYSSLFKLSMLITLSEILFALPLQVLQYEDKPLFYFILNAGKLLIGFTLTIYLVVFKNMLVDGILCARFIGNIIILIIAIFFVILPRCKFHFSINSVIKTIKFGFPLIISNVAFLIFQMSDRYMLNWLSTEAETGKYSFGLKIANIINLLLVQSIGLTYLPSVYSNEEKENNKRYYSKSYTYYCFVVSLLTLAFLFIYEDIIKLVVFNNEYIEGFKVVPILSFNFVILGMNNFLGIGLILKNKTFLYIIPSLITATTNIILNMFLIPSYGIMGASYSTLISQVLYTTILAIISNNIYKIKFEWKKVLIIIFLSIIIFIISEIVNTNYLIINYLIKGLLIIIIPFLLFHLNFFEQIEKEKIKSIFLKYIPDSLIKFFNKKIK